MIGEVVTIPGAPLNPYCLISVRYDYQADPARCPNCGGLGLVWRGWFSCDSRCDCIAVVSDGRAFLPTQKQA